LQALWIFSLNVVAGQLPGPVIATFTFCGPDLDPSLRISSGSFTLGTTSTSEICLLKADADVNTPRIDMDGIELEDLTVKHTSCFCCCKHNPTSHLASSPYPILKLFVEEMSSFFFVYIPQATLMFFQSTHYRDLQLCGRTQAPYGKTYRVT
jgi:hypothetical protein